MNFIEAVKLVNQGHNVYRRLWAAGCQMSKRLNLDSNANRSTSCLIAYHVAACEIPVRIEDMLAEDWEEGNNY